MLVQRNDSDDAAGQLVSIASQVLWHSSCGCPPALHTGRYSAHSEARAVAAQAALSVVYSRNTNVSVPSSRDNEPAALSQAYMAGEKVGHIAIGFLR